MENNSWVEYNVVHCNDEILSSLEKRVNVEYLFDF